MAGGVGSRFWPISRTNSPKQFLDILGTGKTFIRSTFERFRPLVPDANFLVVTNTIYKDQVLEQIPELKPEQVLCEPMGRNTAPAIAYAAFRLKTADPAAEMIVTPSDHLIFGDDEFRGVVSECVEFSRKNNVLMTIGVKPTYPNTGYGYIQIEDGCDEGICKVRTFTEKPNLELAKAFVESGEFFWNSGIFIWKADDILQALENHLPETYYHFNTAASDYGTPREKEAIATIYSETRPISIDFGVMEKASNVYVHCSRFGWSDIGTWGSLYEYSEKDDAGNVRSATSQLYNTSGCIVKAPDDKLVILEGLEDYIVVDTDDVLFVCPKENEQNIKKYIEDIKFSKKDRYI